MAEAAGAEHVAHQFDDADQQRLASELGMWVFLATEVLFFGGMIAAYTFYRFLYPVAFAHGSQHMDVMVGGVNTGVLLASSFTVVLSVHAARVGAKRLLLGALLATIVLGGVFLGFKAYEWHRHWVEGVVPGLRFTYDGPDRAGVGLFFWLYFAMTGVHALHLTIGIGVMAVIAILAWRGRYGPAYHNPVEIAGLYWHFVDVVWIFLLPLLYLIGRHAP
ncbi:MAG TPA: cytochrome c oxidase subunit 3 family protein [Candidatus Binatia bacterium]|nr:cytochrome c oxidase subunit 3 family protein [Candidatus Binatia bacterium]